MKAAIDCDMGAVRRKSTMLTIVVQGTMLLSLSTLITCDEDARKEQFNKIGFAYFECMMLLRNATPPDDGGVYCEPLWDNIMCWPNFTRAGETVKQNCAGYVKKFNPSEMAERYCLKDGTWMRHPDKGINNTWTNYLYCHESDLPQILEANMPIIVKISTIGYSLSLTFLIIATAVMVFFRRLHCQRNTIHINLFTSFMLRAIISLLRNGLLVQGFALPRDVIFRLNGEMILKEGMHWECKLLNTLWQYSLGANYMWIFVEGLYLHTLVFFAVFSQSKKFFKLYIVIGWVFPLFFLIIWVILRIHKDNTFCWNTHDKGFYWVLDTPICTSIVINFFFFLNIIRMLFTKIRSTITRDPGRYRKLAKSTLVLIPLFGVYYIYFIAINYHPDMDVGVIHLYMEMTLNSFQGTVVAFLFCFLNGEVRAEVLKKWNRHWLRRQSIVSGRSSRAFSTTSFYIGRERQSVSQGVPLTELLPKDPIGTPPHSPLNNNNAPMFHKVASMPKMPLTSMLASKPLPRVASSPKVTFSCSESVADTGLSLSVTSLGGGSSSKTKNGILSNGVVVSKIDETTSLLMNGTVANGDVVSVPDTQFSRPSGKGRDIRSLKSRGVAEEGLPALSHVSSVNVLPPLLDVEEDVAETVHMLSLPTV
ncbi:unnamed protein product [Lymnaea stagnalis]|uniref:Uncharacterized protein n=1 Tax=Lymnaea stagnalis TaxID=6523 RepID=A0AAV2GZH8_LYMST